MSRPVAFFSSLAPRFFAPLRNLVMVGPQSTRAIVGHVLFRPAEESHIMGMPATPEDITTIEDLLALPEDGLRHELMDGVHVVTPAPQPRHQLVLSEMAAALREALSGASEYRVLTSPADIVLSPRTLVQPDLFVVRLPAAGAPETWREIGVPRIAVEVLSPGTAARDRGTKRRVYQRAGVAEYWIVDADARLVERWRPGDERPEILDEALRFELPGASAAIDVQAVFRRALGE